MSDSKWRSPCQGGSISSFKLDSTTKSGIKIISNSDDAVERLKTKQTFTDLKIDTKYRKVNYVHFIWRPTYKWSPWHKSYFFSIDLIFWDFLSAGSYSPGYWQSTNRSKACFDANIFPNYLPVPIDKQHLCQTSFISWDITSNWLPWC